MVIKRPPFLTKPYSAYYHRDVPEEDSLVTQIGPGSPAGEYLRLFWQPVIYSHELKDLPVRIRRFGEDLVAFRDKSGHIGLIELHCNHRGTSLEYGKIEEHGVRCCYHGWLFDVDGRILETPLEPPDSTLKDRLHHGAYPTTEYNGLIFAYMGPPEKMPEFPVLDVLEVPGYNLNPGELTGSANPKPCNWLQCLDNFLDPMHEEILHASISGIQFLDASGREVEELAIIGEAEFVPTDTGIITLDMRRVDDSIWVRNIEFVIPNIGVISQAPEFPIEYAPGETERHSPPHLVFWLVPVDDTNTLEFTLVRTAFGERNPRTRKPSPALIANSGGRTYEEMQRMPGDYEAQISQRPIAVHAMEHLASSDRGVTMMRKGLRQAIRKMAEGEVPPGMLRQPGKAVPTYSGDTLMRIPPAATEEEDMKLMRKVGRDLAYRYLKEPPNQGRSAD